MTTTRQLLVTCTLGALALPGCAETDSDLFAARAADRSPSGGETLRLDEVADILSGRLIGDCTTYCGNGGFGVDMQIAGDLDADGFDDLLFLAPLYLADLSGGQADKTGPLGGAIYVVYGRSTWADEATVEPDATLLVVDPPAPFPRARLAAAGDVDGDGYADVLVGAPDQEGCWDPEFGEPPEGRGFGRVHLIYGGPDRLSGSAPVADVASTLVDETRCGGAGVAVASAGDLDGDGYGDFVAGSDPNHEYPSEQTGAGRTHLFYGGPERRPAMSSITAADATLRGRVGTDGFGTGLARSGDVDGDGDSEVLIAERDRIRFEADDGPHFIESAVYLVSGGPRLAGDIDATTAAGIATFSGFGLHGTGSVGLGDLDDDGLDDLALGGWAGSVAEAGGDVAAFLFYGRPDGFASSVPVSSADVILRAPVGNDTVMPIEAAADHDGDGHRDIVIGDKLLDDQRGGAHLIRGTGGRWTGDFPLADIATTYVGSEQGAGEPSASEEPWPPGPDVAGVDVAGGGDVDGDGKADLIVGAPSWELALGRAYILR